MALPIPPTNPNNPIPNNPFYYPETNYIKGEYGPFIVGSGLFIDNVTGVISASGGGGGGGITTLTGTLPISVTGSATAKNVSIAAASTTSAGAVQLYDGLNSTSTSLALTAAQGYNLQQQITALTTASNLTLAGTFDANAASLLTVTQSGTLAGFAVGLDLPSPAPGNRDYFVIATTGGTYNPPGPSGPFSVTAGDWLMSDGTQWNLLDVGPPAANYASPSVAGVVCLSTNALAQAGVDTLTALTPAAARSAFVPLACYPTKGTLLAGTATACAPSALAVGTDGYLLTADSTCPVGFAWKAAPGAVAAIPCACITNKGALITGTGPSAPVALPVGTNGQILAADSTCTSGLKWQTGAVGPWISAGTIQSVGLGATGTPPTLGSTSRNNVSYRQIGPKDWEVVYTFTATGVFNPGAGDWLFKLPGGLQFDTSLPWQPIYQQWVQTSAHVGRAYILPGPSVSQVTFTNSSNGSQFGSGPAIWDLTYWRFLATDVSNGGFRAIGSNYWAASDLAFIMRFQFTSL